MQRQLIPNSLPQRLESEADDFATGRARACDFDIMDARPNLHSDQGELSTGPPPTLNVSDRTPSSADLMTSGGDSEPMNSDAYLRYMCILQETMCSDREPSLEECAARLLHMRADITPAIVCELGCYSASSHTGTLLHLLSCLGPQVNDAPTKAGEFPSRAGSLRARILDLIDSRLTRAADRLALANTRTSLGECAMHMACRYGATCIIKWLIRAGIDPAQPLRPVQIDAHDDDGLARVVPYDPPVTAPAALVPVLSPNETDGDGFPTPAEMAPIASPTDADHSEPPPDDETLPIVVALRAGQADAARVLLEAINDPNPGDPLSRVLRRPLCFTGERADETADFLRALFARIGDPRRTPFDLYGALKKDAITKTKGVSPGCIGWVGHRGSSASEQITDVRHALAGLSLRLHDDRGVTLQSAFPWLFWHAVKIYDKHRQRASRTLDMLLSPHIPVRQLVFIIDSYHC